jgi:hypothetical protein
VNGGADAARSLYLELRALGLRVWVEDDPDGGPLDYGIAVSGLRSLSEDRARRVARCIRLNEEGLVLVLLDRRS